MTVTWRSVDPSVKTARCCGREAAEAADKSCSFAPLSKASGTGASQGGDVRQNPRSAVETRPTQKRLIKAICDAAAPHLRPMRQFRQLKMPRCVFGSLLTSAGGR